MEGGYDNLPGLLQPPGGGFFYWNTRYLDGYTNKGNILGDATLAGQGISIRADTTYWFASIRQFSSDIEANEVDSMFLQGGTCEIFTRTPMEF